MMSAYTRLSYPPVSFYQLIFVWFWNKQFCLWKKSHSNPFLE